MTHLTEETLQDVCENYLNGNIKDAKSRIKLFNKLQLVQFIERSHHFGVKRHQAYTLVVLTLDE